MPSNRQIRSVKPGLGDAVGATVSHPQDIVIAHRSNVAIVQRLLPIATSSLEMKLKWTH